MVKNNNELGMVRCVEASIKTDWQRLILTLTCHVGQEM